MIAFSVPYCQEIFGAAVYGHGFDCRSILPVPFPLFQTRQQQGEQSQEDFIGKGDEVRDDQVGDEEAQGKPQQFRVAKPGGVLQEKISKHVS